MDDDLGLSDRDKELKKWNAPYVYREFPRMLYRGTGVGGRGEEEQRMVGSEGGLGLATATGWDPHPQRALEAEATRQADLGVAAAERAWSDRQLSPAAPAQAAADEPAQGR